VEHLHPVRVFRAFAELGKAALVDWLDRQDTKLASALNPEEVTWPRIYAENVEAPCATEEELG
jgi:hypothetical protein